MVTGVVVCHGNLAQELSNTVARILGPVDALYTLSNENCSPQQLYELLSGVMSEAGDDPVFFLVDLRGGSCWTTARMLSRDYPHIKVITGVNIPMLVSFLTKRTQLSPEELAETLVRDASRGITID